jgi:hypothetical protein
MACGRAPLAIEVSASGFFKNEVAGNSIAPCGFQGAEKIVDV